MNVSKSSNGKALFSIRSADSKDISYRGTSVKKVYEDLIQQVLFINQSYFSSGEKDSIYPIYRSPKRRAYGLNGPQVQFTNVFLRCLYFCENVHPISLFLVFRIRFRFYSQSIGTQCWSRILRRSFIR
jgi:hypothetical protein